MPILSFTEANADQVCLDRCFISCTMYGTTLYLHKKKQRSEDIIAPWNKMKYTAKTENIYTIVWL